MPTPAQPTLDVHFVRSCFPAFAERLASTTAFFENAGGSYTAAAVIERLLHFYTHNKVQPYGFSELGRVAGEQMDAGRQAIADLLGVEPTTLTLGASTTQNINSLAHACAPLVTPQSKVMVTAQDHEANIGAWQRLCQRQGADLLVWPVDASSGELDYAAFEALLEPRVRIVCMTQSSNIVGSVNPVDKVLARCRRDGIRVVIDAVSFAPHRWPDLPTLQPDAYCFSTYKTYATHLGVMYVAPDFSAELAPQCHYFNTDYADKKLDTAGPDHASIAALAGLGRYFAASYQHHFPAAQGDNGQVHPAAPTPYQQAQRLSALMHVHETELGEKLLDGIADLPLRIIGRRTMSAREANFALTAAQFSAKQLCQALAAKGIAAGHGHFYARRLLENLGLHDPDDGVLRLSLAHYNTADEVARVVDALREMCGNI